MKLVTYLLPCMLAFSAFSTSNNPQEAGKQAYSLLNTYLLSIYPGFDMVGLHVKEIVTPSQEQFSQHVNFIKDSTDDHPLNASINEKTVAYLVVIANDRGSIVVALNDQFELLGLAESP